MANDSRLRGQLLRIIDLYGLNADCQEDLLELLEEVAPAEPSSAAVGAASARSDWTWGAEPGPAVIAGPVRLSAPEVRGGAEGSRYEDLVELGVGGMGEVWRVYDRQLRRVMARKALKPTLMHSTQARGRFLAEARITAQLQHPGIIPVHDVGELSTGQPYYTMREVRGHTLRDAIDAVHGASTPEVWGEAAVVGHETTWTLRRLLAALRRGCEAVAYAHSRGVIHRDIKPDNIMVGAFGEVLVMDWGVALVLDQQASRFAENPIVGVPETPGGLAGTLVYMPFEQVDTGRLVSPRSDIYALGATMYHLLAGQPPYSGDLVEVRRRLLAGGPPHPRSRGGPPIPEELGEACMTAMAREPEDRFASATELAESITAWLEGARMRDRALEIVQRADRLLPEVTTLREQARALRAEAEQVLGEVRPHEPAERKREGWDRQDAADALSREAALKDLQYRETLRTALHYVRDLPEAHDRLADYHAARHAEAEAASDPQEAELQERLLRAHDRGRYAAYLRGEGALTLLTDPPGASVRLYRYVLQQRRLIPVPEQLLGTTPLHAVRLPIGSYLLKLQHPERAEVAYPIQLRRQEHWDGVPPGQQESLPIYLPLRRELRSGDIYIPAGWFWSGGDPDAGRALPRRRLWVDGLILSRFPVTNAEYIAFLDDLVAQGREDLALRYAPRERPTASDPEGGLLYGRSAQGRFLLGPDAHGDVWLQDMPAILMPWGGVVAYSHWRAQRDGLPWRLPGELEWEKAGRGVDGRLYPWGDNFDPSWCCSRESHPGRAQPVSVSSFPVDESPYGVRGMAGNTRDWCGDIYGPQGPRLEGGARVLPPTLPSRVELHPGHTGVSRGGAWWYSPREARLTYRTIYLPAVRFHPLSFRLARSFPSPPDLRR